MSYFRRLENPKQVDLINKAFNINLQKNGFITKEIKKNNFKNINFYNIEENNNQNDNNIDIILTFFYSININEDIRLPFDISEEEIFKNCNFSWENIFKFLSLYININDIYELLNNKVKYTEKNKDMIKKRYLDIIKLCIEKYISCLVLKKVEFKDFYVWTNSSILSMSRKIIIPNQLRYLNTTNLKKINNLQIKLSNFNNIYKNNNNARIISKTFDKNNVEVIFIRPLSINTHMLYLMNEIAIFDEISGLFQDIRSLLIIYTLLLEDEDDMDYAMNIGLINTTSIPYKMILSFLREFSKKFNYEIELLHYNWINELELEKI